MIHILLVILLSLITFLNASPLELISCDGHKFVVPEEIVALSPLLHSESLKGSNLRFANINGAALGEILNYMTSIQNGHEVKPVDSLKSLNAFESLGEFVTYTCSDEYQKEVDHRVELILAADSLELIPLAKTLLKTFVSSFGDNEIRTLLNTKLKTIVTDCLKRDLMIGNSVWDDTRLYIC